MATTTINESRQSGLRASAPVKLSWSAIFGGTVAALGVWALLYALGLALGLSTIDPNNPESAKASGIFTGIWSLIAPLIALFIGGMVAGRGAGSVNRVGGALHGFVMWGLTTLVGAWLIGNLLASLIGGAGQMASSAVQSAGSAMSGQAQQGGKTFGLNANDALKPINQRLQAEGKPEITSDQLQAATKDVFSSAVRDGKIDRETLVTSIASNTNLSRQDAEDVANRVDQQFNDAKGKVQTGALKAADTTGKAMWGVFGAMLLGLISAILGGVVGVSRRQQQYADNRVITSASDTTDVNPTYPQQPLHQ